MKLTLIFSLVVSIAWLPTVSAKAPRAVSAAASSEDVLFLDMNASVKEKEAAREAARKAGRRFVAYPDLSAEDGRELNRLDDEFKKTSQQRKKLCSASEGPACSDIQKKIAAIREARGVIYKKNSFTENAFAELLAKQAADGRAFATVVVSGHDGTGDFSGLLGHIGDKDLAKHLGAHPALKDGVRSLHLWGCNTTTPGSLLMNWTKQFPRALFISGYDESAPANTREGSWKYLAAVIEKESAFQEITDAKKLQRMLKGLPHVNEMHAAVYSCGAWASNKDTVNLDEYQARCEGLKKEILANEETYQCYLKAPTEACKNPPADKANGPVRAFYRILQRAEGCNATSRDPAFRQYSRDQVIRLNFFDEITRNASRIYADELKQSDDLLERLGAPAGLRFADLEKLSRKELREKIEELDRFLIARLPDLNADPALASVSETHAEETALRNLRSSLLQSLFSLEAHCVPFNWTEPDKTEESRCANRNRLGNAGVAKEMASKGENRKQLLRAMDDALQKRIEEEKLHPSGNAAIDKARQTTLFARLNRLQRHEWSDQAPGKPEEVWNARVALAELRQRLTESGVEDLSQDPAAILARYRTLRIEAEAALARENSPEMKEALGDGPRLLAEGFALAESIHGGKFPAEEHERLQRELSAKKQAYGEARFQQQVRDLDNQIEQNRELIKKFAPDQQNIRSTYEEWTKIATDSLNKIKAEKAKWVDDAIKEQFDRDPLRIVTE